ncbi:MAG TPA: P-type conjugative transfer protein TrbL [Burkholderiales bacterium]|nr:P-type conjugative transfer protein TrbL [Burkholderiales bacterium]
MACQWTKAFWHVLAVLVGLLTFCGAAHAVSIDLGGGPGVFSFFDPFDAIAKGQGKSFMNKITDLVTDTFWILAVIELAWAASLWVIEKDNMHALMAEMLQKIMFIAFFFLLLQKGPEWFPIIIDSFRDAGQKTIGNVVTNPDGSVSGAPLSPDTIVATGFAIINLIWANSPFEMLEKYKHSSLWSAFDGVDNLVEGCMIAVNTGLLAVKIAFEVIKIFTPDAIDSILDAIIEAPCRIFVFLLYLPQIVCALLATVVVAVAHIVTAIQLLALNIESYVLLAAGAIFLGLGSSRWTNEYTTKLFSYALNVGFRLLVLILVLGLTKDLVQDALDGFEFEVGPLLKLAGVSLLQMLLAIKAPDMAHAFMSGDGAGMSLGGMAASVRSVADGAKMLKGAVQAPGKAVNSGVNAFTKTKNFLKGSSDKKDSGSVKGL